MIRPMGINVVAFWPKIARRKGLELAVTLAQKSGFEGVQTLPMRFWNKEHHYQFDRNILASEDAWNFGPLWQVVLRTLHIKGDPYPTILDWILFGAKYSPAYPGAVQCIHTFGPPETVTEIHPELSTNHYSYFLHYTRGGSFCWDTLHVRREKRNGAPGIQDWEKLLDMLDGSSIKLVHVHPSNEEMRSLMEGRQSELTKMLHLVGKKTRAPAILEIPPLFLTPVKSPVLLSILRSNIQGWLDGWVFSG